MEAITEINLRRAAHSRLSEVNFEELEFGLHVSDHMFTCEYFDGGWQQPEIGPYEEFSISPSALALHYGQTVFEGMKAFRMHDGRINVFRIDKHYDRFVESLERMCMPVMPKEMFIEGMLQLISIDSAWVPQMPGDALYIRPFVIATEARLGVKISERYRFMITTGPVPSLYNKPIRVKIETRFVRAAAGGTGFAKCGGNYGASFYPTKLAREEGYDQVLWTDACEHRFIEESGMMNAMFVIDGKIRTAPLSDSILDGVTRDSLLQIANDNGYPVDLTQVSVSELTEGLINGRVTEAFGAGTAAVIAPIEIIGIEGADYRVPGYSENSICLQLKGKLDAIRNGSQPDVYSWNSIVS